MTIDVFTATGEKKGTTTLPSALFEAPIRMGLLHQAVVMQQANRRAAIAHTKSRGEIRGSTRKLYQQKGTGRARRGPIRSPLLRGGNKAFGPKSVANFTKRMPHAMRRAALLGSLSLQAKRGAILGLEDYPDTIKTKLAATLLRKLPVEFGRPILFVTPGQHRGLLLSTRNLPTVKAITAAYLNPEDVLRARHLIFLVEAIRKAEEVFGKGKVREIGEVREAGRVDEEEPTKKPVTKRKATAKKAAKTSQASLTSTTS
jgi:large subunit ribosomal protein L4